MGATKVISPARFIMRSIDMEQVFKPALAAAKEEVGREAKEHFDRSFRNEGFTDTRLEKWPKRNPDRRPQDKTLYETGALSSSTEYRVMARGVSIINKVKYGIYHNTGKGQKLRRFIGNSVVLNRRIKVLLTRRLITALEA